MPAQIIHNRRGTIVELREEGRKFGAMNRVRGKAGTYRLLSVYAPVGGLESEELVTSKSYAIGLGDCWVIECLDCSLLLVWGELYGVL